MDKCVLLKDHNAVTLEHLTPRSRDKHSTTEPLRSLLVFDSFVKFHGKKFVATTIPCIIQIFVIQLYSQDCSVECILGNYGRGQYGEYFFNFRTVVESF